MLHLEGWLDAGMAASGAASSILGSVTTHTVAVFDSDTLVDQRARRPTATLADGEVTTITWPEIRLEAGRDDSGQPVAFLLGPEPDLHWRPFAAATAELCDRLGIRIAAGLGSFPAPAPHTRPIKVAATSIDQALASDTGVVPGVMEVPIGIQTVIEVALGEAGIPAVGLWARVPHYVAAMPYPSAAGALVDALVEVTGLHFDSGTLHAAGDVARQKVTELFAHSEEHRAILEQLEANLDAAEGNPLDVGGELPSGDDLAAELERFLRGQA